MAASHQGHGLVDDKSVQVFSNPVFLDQGKVFLPTFLCLLLSLLGQRCLRAGLVSDD